MGSESLAYCQFVRVCLKPFNTMSKSHHLPSGGMALKAVRFVRVSSGHLMQQIIICYSCSYLVSREKTTKQNKKQKTYLHNYKQLESDI